MLQSPNKIAFIIILAQFLGTSLWFVGNIALPLIPIHEDGSAATSSEIGMAIIAVQAGFIVGTMLFGLLALADRFSPSRVFGFSALCAALANVLLLIPHIHLELIITSRFATGFFLAGIYPVGMKIAADYNKEGLGKILGYLVGALVLGTALPHFLNATGWHLSYKNLTITTSCMALLGGGLIVFFIKDGPFRVKQKKLNFKAISQLFKNSDFKNSALGYFGHMWELYTFWGFLPIYLGIYSTTSSTNLNISLWAFIGIAIGAIGCAYGGYRSLKVGSLQVARRGLIISAICCLLSPWAIFMPDYLFKFFILIWGIAVVIDSPQLSSLIAKNAKSIYKGTALTVVNSLGYVITILSIQCITLLKHSIPENYMFMPLLFGPLLGIFHLYKIHS